MSKKHQKKLRCVCKGKGDRIHPGTDNQRHTYQCPMALHNRKDR
jgi:hypothetical protein